METFNLRELRALKGALTGSLSGRSNELDWKAHEHLDLVAKLERVVHERESTTRWVSSKTNLESLEIVLSDDSLQKETQQEDLPALRVALPGPE